MVFNPSVFSLYASTYPIVKYVFTYKTAYSLKIDSSCPDPPNASIACRTIVVPAGGISYVYLLEVIFNNNEVYPVCGPLIICKISKSSSYSMDFTFPKSLSSGSATSSVAID